MPRERTDVRDSPDSPDFRSSRVSFNVSRSSLPERGMGMESILVVSVKLRRFRDQDRSGTMVALLSVSFSLPILST